MILTIKKLLFFLDYNDRKKALGLLVMIVIMAILDLAGVASILPFISVLTDSNLIKTNKFLAYTYGILNFTDTQSFLFFLGTLVLVSLVVSLSFKSLTTYYQLRFNQIREYTISKKLMKNYLSQPYSWFLHKNSADIGNNLLKEVNQVVVSAMGPIMNIIAQSFIAIAMISLIIFINPKLALLSAGILSTAYGLLYYGLKGYLLRIGSERLKSSQKKHKIINEAFYGIKEVKVGELEKLYSDLFSESAKIFANSNAKLHVVMQIPRYVIEATFFGGAILFILILIKGPGDLISNLPFITVFSFAAYRLIPALQLIYSNASQLQSAKASIDLLYKDINGLSKIKKVSKKVKKIHLQNGVKLNEVSFTYPLKKSKTITNLNIFIPANKTIALIGSSGCGKTTTADLILGLFQPDSGKITVDNIEINETNIISWKSNIGYVPQQIFLTDDTISSNIAFGVKKKEIDFEQVKKVAKIANLNHFITNELEEGYSSIVGERGIRLSGGQRQRIGIARALYFNPQLLILDEATSALDNITEQAFLNALNKISGKITIIMIAHRISTVKDADLIYLMEQGKVVANGSYGKLVIESDKFKMFVNKNNNP